MRPPLTRLSVALGLAPAAAVLVSAASASTGTQTFPPTAIERGQQ